jgi:16S rRNA processing protein RimM
LADEPVFWAVGRIVRPHGIRGELLVEVRTDDPGRRFAPRTVLSTDPPAAGPLTVVTVRPHTKGLLVTFAEVADRSSADPLRGTWLAMADDEDAGPDSGAGPDSDAGADGGAGAGGGAARQGGSAQRGGFARQGGSASGEGAPAEGDEGFHDRELTGLTVMTTGGEPVGTVTDVLHYGQDLLVISPATGLAAHRDVLVPFVAAIVVDVDVAAGRLVIDPPAGLLDLAAE